MKVQLKAFGIAKDILGDTSLEIDIQERMTVQEFKIHIAEAYPDFKVLANFNIAINEEYAMDSDQIVSGSEIVIIPPVSGG